MKWLAILMLSNKLALKLQLLEAKQKSITEGRKKASRLIISSRFYWISVLSVTLKDTTLCFMYKSLLLWKCITIEYLKNDLTCSRLTWIKTLAARFASLQKRILYYIRFHKIDVYNKKLRWRWPKGEMGTFVIVSTLKRKLEQM